MGTLLLLKILRGRDLAACDSNGLSDPYVKLTYQKVKAKTQIIRKTLNPVWNEAFPFGVVPVGAEITLECWDWDKLSSDDFMGQAVITITPEIAEVGTHRMWLQLQGRGNKKENVSGAIEVEFVVRLIDEVLGNVASDKPKRSARRSITHLVRLGSAGSVSNVMPPTALSRSASGALSPKGEATPRAARSHPLFGVELEDLMAAQAATHPKLKIPLFLHKTLEWLHAHNMDETIGIFRVGGVQRRMASIRAELENNPPSATVYQDDASIHDISGLVKAWLRELPTPLWTFPLYDVFFDAAEQTKVPSQEIVLAALSTLPEHNIAVTHTLMRMCHELALNKEVNRMDAQNLAIVIAPNLLWKPQAEDTLTSLMEYRNSLAVITDITQALIENYDDIPMFTSRDQAESDTAACNSGPVLIGRSRQRVYAPVAPKILSIAEMDSHTLFSSFDIDGSGALDPLEFAVFYKDLSAALGKRTPTNCEIMEVINAVDANGDGEITFAEFSAWWDQRAQQ